MMLGKMETTRRAATLALLLLLSLPATQAKDRVPAPVAVVNFRGEDLPVFAPPHPISPTRRVAPTYPPDERSAGIEGEVVLTILTGADGQVLEVEVISSDPEASFGAAARKAALQWRYAPVLRNGKATKFIVEQRIDFTLEKSAGSRR